jgi:hypothetical protein
MVLVLAKPRKGPTRPHFAQEDMNSGIPFGVRTTIPLPAEAERRKPLFHSPLETSRAHRCACQ